MVRSEAAMSDHFRPRPRPHALWVAAALALTGCPPAPGPTRPPSAPAAPNDPVRSEPSATDPLAPRPAPPLPTLADLLPVQPEPLRFSGSARTGGSRHALLVVADRYAVPEFDLKAGERAIVRLQGALMGGLGIAGERVRVLRGKDATAAAIQRELKTLGTALRGPDNLVVVYYFGHGWVRSTGELELFTYDTERDGAIGYRQTISHAELGHGYLALAEAARAQQATAQIVSVIDACRVGTQAPPRQPTYRPLPDVAEVFSAKLGQFANEGLFVEAFCDALDDGARRDRTLLGEVFDAARASVLPGMEILRRNRHVEGGGTGAADLTLTTKVQIAGIATYSVRRVICGEACTVLLTASAPEAMWSSQEQLLRACADSAMPVAR